MSLNKTLYHVPAGPMQTKQQSSATSSLSRHTSFNQSERMKHCVEQVASWSAGNCLGIHDMDYFSSVPHWMKCQSFKYSRLVLQASCACQYCKYSASVISVLGCVEKWHLLQSATDTLACPNITAQINTSYKSPAEANHNFHRDK